MRRPFPHRPSNRFQPVRSSVSRAYWSHADEESEDVCWEYEHDADDEENDVSDATAYWCQSCGPDGEFGDVVDRMEQDIVCAFVAADCSLSDEDVCEDISGVFTQNVPLSSDVNRHVSTVCMWKKSCTASDQNQSWKSRNVESLSSMRREIRHAEHVDGRAIGLVIKFVQNFVGSRSAPGSSTRPWNANWSRDVSKTDKRHMKGKDQPKGAGKHTSFRTRAPFNREARIAQAMNDEAGKCTGRCFKFAPLLSLK